MKLVRIYKVKIRENILRSMFFTDRNLLIGGVLLIDGGLFLLLRKYRKDIMVIAFLIADIFFVLFMTMKIDRQPMFVIMKRFILYLFRNKSERF